MLKIGLYGGLLALVALVVAVGVAMSSLPSYQELVRRDDLGQMIRVRAADGIGARLARARASANGCATTRSRRS